ncbi:MAG: IPT/TIG domain-containing protein, partial [Planctomycetes bacterium]|nr:IPT/TIG domain-containing protein [Planctomycetota bacterium]
MVRSAGLVPAALLAALLLPSSSPAATTGGTPVGSGDRITGTIDGPSDTDAFLIEAPAGSRLQVEVKAGRKSALLPLLAVRRPDGTAVDLSRIVVGENGPVVSVTDLGVSVSGAWTVEVRGMGSTAGDYQALIGAEVDRKLRTTVEVPAGGTVVRDFTAWDGVQVAWSAREAGGAGLAEAGLCCPHRNPIAGTEGVRKGARIVGPKSVLGRGPGLYGLVLRGSDAGPTTVEVKVSLRFPKVKRSKVGLGEEPRPGSFSPTVGRDGTQVVLTGTGFVEGSRVFFDGDHEADAVLAGDTLTVTCPPCPASDAGEAVSVTVLNPDGQTGTAADSFQYLGVPRPLGASPLLSPVEGGERIRVHGSGFRAGFTVLFDGVPAPDTDVDTPGLLTCWTPAHAEDVVDVVVLDEFGRPGASIPGFRFADPPVVDVATPATLPSHGGRTVALAGSHFVPGDRVFLDGVEASGVAVQGWNGLSFTAPAGSAGPVEIEVRDPLGRSWIGSGLLEFTPSLVSAAGLLPPAPTGADFFGDALVVGDCTGDGLPDLVISSPVARTNTVTKATAPSTSLLVNDGSGRFANRTFSLPAPTAVESGQADALSVGDLDGDGASEILLSRASPPRAAADTVLYAGLPAYYRVDPSSTSWDRPTLRATRLLAADAGGTFSDDGGTRLPDPGVPPCEGFGERWQASASALGDLDGDGGDDLVLAAGGEVREGTIADVYWIQKKMKYGYWPYYYYYYVREKSYLTEESARKGALRPLMNAGKGVLEDRGNGPGLLTDSGKAILDDFRGSACAAG